MDRPTGLFSQAPQPTDKTDDTPSLAQWEDAIRRGAQAALDGHAGVALRYTREALTIAQALLDDGMATACAPPAAHTPRAADSKRGGPDDCIAALVVSHHNLADLYRAANLPDQAAAHLCRAHATLMALLGTAASHDPSAATDMAWQQAAWRHSRETHAALLLFVREQGPHPAVTQALQDHANPAAVAGMPRH